MLLNEEKREILRGICKYQSLDFSEIKELINVLKETNVTDDFSLEFSSYEIRIISDLEIWEIYKEEIKNITEDCYSDIIKFDKIPSWLAVNIDWEETAQNCYVDGYGHTFSSYDGSEHSTKNFWYFLNNC